MDYFCVIQWDEHTRAEDAILDESTMFFRHLDEAEDYAMSHAYSKAACLNLLPSAIQQVRYETGLVITVDTWTCVIRAFPDA